MSASAPWGCTSFRGRQQVGQRDRLVAAAFGRAIAEVGASLMVGGNIAGQTRVLTTAITLETSRGEFARAIALGLVLLTLAFLVNIAFSWAGRRRPERQRAVWSR